MQMFVCNTSITKLADTIDRLVIRLAYCDNFNAYRCINPVCDYVKSPIKFANLVYSLFR